MEVALAAAAAAGWSAYMASVNEGRNQHPRELLQEGVRRVRSLVDNWEKRKLFAPEVLSAARERLATAAKANDAVGADGKNGAREGGAANPAPPAAGGEGTCLWS